MCLSSRFIKLYSSKGRCSLSDDPSQAVLGSVSAEVQQELEDELTEARLMCKQLQQQVDSSQQQTEELASAQDRCMELEQQLAGEKQHVHQLQEQLEAALEAADRAGSNKDLERRLVAALAQVDESIAMATTSEQQKREFMQQVGLMPWLASPSSRQLSEGNSSASRRRRVCVLL